MNPPNFRTIDFRGCMNCQHKYEVQTVENMFCTKYGDKSVYVYDTCDDYEPDPEYFRIYPEHGRLIESKVAEVIGGRAEKASTGDGGGGKV